MEAIPSGLLGERATRPSTVPCQCVEFATRLPTSGLRWYHCTHAGGISERRMDAGGFACYVQPLTGRRLYWLQKRSGAVLPEDGSGNEGELDAFVVLLLEPHNAL